MPSLVTVLTWGALAILFHYLFSGKKAGKTPPPTVDSTKGREDKRSPMKPPEPPLPSSKASPTPTTLSPSRVSLFDPHPSRVSLFDPHPASKASPSPPPPLSAPSPPPPPLLISHCLLQKRDEYDEKSPPPPLLNLSQLSQKRDAPLVNLFQLSQKRDAPLVNLSQLSQKRDAPLVNVYQRLQKRDAPLVNVCQLLQKRDAPLVNVCQLLQKRDAPLVNVCQLLQKRDAPLVNVCQLLQKRDAPLVNVCQLLQKRDEYDEKWPDLSSIKQKSMLPRYEIPNHLKELIEMDKVPSVLRGPLTPLTYADYFASLLYAEDFYCEKWSKFILSAVTLKLYSRATFENARGTNKMSKSVPKNKKDFVAFEIDSIPERRPFLLSRDFVFVRPSGEKTEPFKGILFRAVKSTTLLVEFEDDFHAQHSSTKKYDVSFSFNRVCLKRCHHAVSVAKHPSLQNMLFPDARSNPSFLYSPHIGLKQGTSQILNHKGALPYLIEGLLSTTQDKLSTLLSTTPEDQLSTTGSFIREAVLQIYSNIPQCRILICSPRNLTCDAFMRSFHKEIPESELFRANAAFRDYDLVPDNIKPACLYEGECFTCPPLSELQNFRIISSTFMSSFRLHSAGITDDHFTHIFLVDASSATEPETVVTLANLVSKKTVVVVTGSSRDLPGLVRSDIARRHGLNKSYFHRLLEREPYMGRDPKFITSLI